MQMKEEETIDAKLASASLYPLSNSTSEEES
jgi:hypothetical protein